MAYFPPIIRVPVGVVGGGGSSGWTPVSLGGWLVGPPTSDVKVGRERHLESVGLVSELVSLAESERISYKLRRRKTVDGWLREGEVGYYMNI